MAYSLTPTVEDVDVYFSTARKNINDSLIQYLPPLEEAHQPQIHTAIHYSILGVGHRYRPILLLAIAEGYEANPAQALPMACVVEMIHTAAMIIDDLPSFDNADVRHAKPACHKQFGEYVAILASHRLLSQCLEVMRGLRNDLAPHTSELLESEYTILINAMVRGEGLDVATRHDQIDSTTLTDIYVGKSAQLFSFAAVTGAALGQATSREMEAVRHYGLNIGLAYQILDDIYDIEGGPGNIGKNTGMDQKNGKATTFPLRFGITKSRRLMELYKRRACMVVERMGDRATTLLQLADKIAPS